MFNYYIALIHKEADRDYGIMFPDFPGCISAGSTVEEAIAMATEALSFHAANMLADGEEIPAARNLDEIRDAGDEWIDFGGASMVTFVPLLPTAQGKPQATNLSLDSGLVEAADIYGHRVGLTRSAVFAEGARLLMQMRPAPADRPVRQKKQPGRKAGVASKQNREAKPARV